LSLIADYLLLSAGKAGEKSARTRLGHVVRYVNTKNPAMTAAQADEKFATAFRKWLGAEKITGGSRGGEERLRALSSIEGALMQLAAAINATPGQKAGFTVVQQKEVSASPQYRADVPTIAAMFNYCLRPDDKSVRHWRNPDEINANLVARRVEERANLLRYLRAAVATWARPDALYDLRKRQWHSASGSSTSTRPTGDRPGSIDPRCQSHGSSLRTWMTWAMSGCRWRRSAQRGTAWQPRSGCPSMERRARSSFVEAWPRSRADGSARHSGSRAR
jgi:hypothetical protein